MPVTITAARQFVTAHHRHHRAPQGGLFAVGVEEGGIAVGVAIIGRPVARMLQDGWTAEVTRVAVLEGYPNACSMLYGAAWRACRALGYRRLITYTLESEAGTSVRASGWTPTVITPERSWDRPKRARTDTHPTEAKQRWERTA